MRQPNPIDPVEAGKEFERYQAERDERESKLHDEIATLEQELAEAKAGAGEMRIALELVEFPYMVATTLGEDAEHRKQVIKKALSTTAGTSLLREIEQLRLALAFYANEHNYNDDPSDIPGCPVPGTAPIWVDHGGKAQQALKGVLQP